MTKRFFDLVVACICCAISFPVIGFKAKRRAMGLGWLPIPPDQGKLELEIANPENSWFHLKKDLFVNSVREDAEWWGKFLPFCIVSLIVLFAAVIVAAVVILA